MASRSPPHSGRKCKATAMTLLQCERLTKVVLDQANLWEAQSNCMEGSGAVAFEVPKVTTHHLMFRCCFLRSILVSIRGPMLQLGVLGA